MYLFHMTGIVLLLIMVHTICGQKSEFKEDTWKMHPDQEKESTWLMDSKFIFILMIIAVVGIVLLNIKHCKNLGIKTKSSEHVV